MVGGTQTVLDTGMIETPTIPDSCSKQDYSLLIEGYLRVHYPHEVLFRLRCADGAILWLNGQRVLDHDEPHAYSQQIANVKLEQGLYHFKLAYTSFRHAGQLELLGSNPASEFAPISPSDLFHAKK